MDGATLTSRLSKLAPVSFLNPADGLTRRRLFSTDSWELNRFVYANDNPVGLGQPSLLNGSNGQFYYNSRFMPYASSSLENMNQVVAPVVNGNTVLNPSFANPIATEFLPNPTFPPQANNLSNGNSLGTSISTVIQNNSGSQLSLPRAVDHAQHEPLQQRRGHGLCLQRRHLQCWAIANQAGPTVQVQTPSIAHGDRKINLNFPLPISNDPAEPVRQKWCRETYQLLKAILPPASVDTPEELAALSQFVVNIIDFRDTDCTMTRFVNTDLMVTDVLTKQASNTQTDPLDLTWTVSPGGVQFADPDTTKTQHAIIPSGNFPYDPSLYSPDMVTPFLVQHGMEYNPIAINEVLAYQAPYSSATNVPGVYQAMFVELVNTLTEELNNTGTSNASAISLEGWDIIIAPDDFGWGRPDPISGDVNQIANPPWTPNPAPPAGTGDPTMAPVPYPAIPSTATPQRPHPTPTDQNLKDLYGYVQQFSFTNSPRPVISAINPNVNGGNPNPFIVGDYRDKATKNQIAPTSAELNPVATTTGANPTLNVRFPATFQLPTPPNNGARYYWVYLRRPANPFDVTPANQVRPNKEMVVVDCMRFPVIDAGGTVTPGTAVPPVNPTATRPNQVYSAQRLQPYRGGHLVRVDTSPPTSALTTDMMSPVFGVTTICPPSPPYAYGYSEQTELPPTASNVTTGLFQYTVPAAGSLATTLTYMESINATNSNPDSTWSHIPFNDRDFSSVAELLLVPGCPPGLFTKQFVEEQYPGNVLDNSGNPATGTDNRNFATPVVAPTTTNPSLVGRRNFNASGTAIPAPSYPYLPDNFYYTAASVTPPAPPRTQPRPEICETDQRDRRLERGGLAQDARVLRGPQFGQRRHRHR